MGAGWSVLRWKLRKSWGALGLRPALTHSGDRQRVWQEPNRASAEASSIEDTKIETKETAETALKLIHPTVLLEQHLFIHLSFSKSKGRDQMSPVGKPQFISQTQSRVETTQEKYLFMARPSSIMKSLRQKVFLLALNRAPTLSVYCPGIFKASESAISGPGLQGQNMGVQGRKRSLQRSPETHTVQRKDSRRGQGGNSWLCFY